MSRRMKGQLVTEYLESIHGDVFRDHPELVRAYIKGRYGVYALYREQRLYYVGLASNLGWRLRHHMKDHHAGRWNRFSIYMTNNQQHMKDLESLMLRIAKPSGNRVKGQFAHAVLLKRRFMADLRQKQKEVTSYLVGDGQMRTTIRLTSSTQHERLGCRATMAPYVNKPFTIRMKYKGRTIKARVRSDGTINWNGDVFNSPSRAAARAMKRRSANGWWWWHFKNTEGSWVRLAGLRRKTVMRSTGAKKAWVTRRGAPGRAAPARKFQTRRANDFDLLICPAREDGFQRTVLRENRWYAIRIDPKKIPQIRRVAFYRTRPLSAITHWATIASIKPYKSTRKYVVNFKGKARKLSHPVRLGNRRVGPQGPFFSRVKVLKAARTLADL
jgi:hypothetical protein